MTDPQSGIIYFCGDRIYTLSVAYVPLLLRTISYAFICETRLLRRQLVYENGGEGVGRIDLDKKLNP